MTRSGSAPGGADDRDRDKGKAARSARRDRWPRRQYGNSRAPRKQARGPDEHHDDEEGEGEHVAPFEVGEQAAERDDLGEYEGGDEAADEIAQAAEHADQEGDRAEGEADEGMHVILQHQ